MTLFIHTGIVKLLLAHPRIDVNKARWDGTTALFLACEANQSKAVELLLRCPATDTAVYNDDGNTSADLAKNNSGVQFDTITEAPA